MCKMASLCKKRGAAAEAAPRPTRGRAGEPFEAVERLLLYILLLCIHYADEDHLEAMPVLAHCLF